MTKEELRRAWGVLDLALKNALDDPAEPLTAERVLARARQYGRSLRVTNPQLNAVLRAFDLDTVARLRAEVTP